MFTGIVTEMGRIAAVIPEGESRLLVVSAPATSATLEVGASVAVDGVCLTAVAIAGDRFSVQAVPETLGRTTLGELQVGAVVDLERPVPAEGRLDGHIVQGHVDGIGTVAAVRSEGAGVRMRIDVPAGLARYVVEKGSIAVNGVSLTVTAVSAADGAEGSWFEVALIPHTLTTTVLGTKRVGDRVNLEVDVIAKYVERWMEART